MSLVDQVGSLLAAGDLAGATALVEGAAAGAEQELGRAQLALARQDAKAGAAHARRALELGGGGRAHHVLAAAKLFGGDPSGAIDEARRGVGLDSSPRSRSNLGGILLAAGRVEDAMAVLKQVVAEAPDDAEAHTNLANASVRVGDYGQAIMSYARVFEARPHDHQSIQNLVAMFADIGKWMGAMAALELSRKGEPPGDVAVALDLANIHIVRMITGGKFPPAGMTEEADDAVKGLVVNSAGRPVATRLYVARTLLDLDRVAEAKQVLAKVERTGLSAEHGATATYLDGYFAEQAGDRAKALELYLQALAADPKRVEAAINASSLLLEDGSPAALERIAGLLGRVAPAVRNNPNLLYNEASMHARAGRTAEARHKLELVLGATAADSPHAARARLALDELARASR